jgi:FixJ family two-component response regulator
MNSSRPLPAVEAAEPIVYVIDDDDSLRGALESLFRSVGVRVQSFSSAEEMLEHELPEVPSCLVLDVRLQGISGLDLQLQLSDLRDKLPIIFMSGHGDIAMTVRAMKAGALDFLPKPFREQDLLDAVASALTSSRLSRESSRVHLKLEERYAKLTTRERQIMTLAVNGLMNKNIAAELDLREITVKIHRRSAMLKMSAKSFAELVKMGNDLNLV